MNAESAPALRGVPVLVTGGAGFIGSHLVQALLELGARVRVLDNFATGRRQNLGGAAGQIELHEADLRDQESCRRACAGMRFVFHQAALGSVPRSLADPATTLAVNALGTAKLFTAAHRAGVERIVYASSSSVYGDATTLPRREGEEGKALSPYALSKQMGEQIATTFFRCYGIASVGLRYFNVYGPRQDPHGPYAAVIPAFLWARLRGQAPTVFGDGAQSRDFTWIGDVVTANFKALAAAAAQGEAINVGGGQSHTILDLDRQLARLVGGPRAQHGPPRPGDVRHAHADLTLAAERLGYAPAVELTDGLERSLGYYRRLLTAGAGV